MTIISFFLSANQMDPKQLLVSKPLGPFLLPLSEPIHGSTNANLLALLDKLWLYI
jgi:hypothetical protein